MNSSIPNGFQFENKINGSGFSVRRPIQSYMDSIKFASNPLSPP